MRLNVRIMRGSFDFAHPGEKQVQVFAQIPDVVQVSYLLPERMWDDVRDAEWIDALNEAHDYYAKNVWISTDREKRETLRAWLAVDENQDLLNQAWFEQRARRDPVARTLMADKKRLESRVAELESELATLRAKVSEQHDDLVHALGYDRSTLEWSDLVGMATSYMRRAEGLEKAKDERITELEESPLAWAERLDLKSLDNLLISLAQATEYEPMLGAISQIHEVLRGFRAAVAVAGERS